MWAGACLILAALLAAPPSALAGKRASRNLAVAQGYRQHAAANTRSAVQRPPSNGVTTDRLRYRYRAVGPALGNKLARKGRVGVLRSLDAVVKVRVRDGHGTGSILALSADRRRALVLTNHHVAFASASDSSRVVGIEQGAIRSDQIRVLARDAQADLALIEVSFAEPLDGATSVTLGRKVPKKKSKLFVSGFPLIDAPDRTVRPSDRQGSLDGQWFASGRTTSRRLVSETLIQGDTAIVFDAELPVLPGASGSPVLDKHGRLRGVISGGTTLDNLQRPDRWETSVVPVSEVRRFLRQNARQSELVDELVGSLD